MADAIRFDIRYPVNAGIEVTMVLARELRKRCPNMSGPEPAEPQPSDVASKAWDHASRMADQLCDIYASFSNDMKEMYNEIGQYKPAEIHIFILSATSVMIQMQTQRGIPESDMKFILDKFTKKGMENLLAYMPSADYELIYNVFSVRFAEYADLVASVFNQKPRGNWDVDSASASLLGVANVNIGVERDPFNLAMDALRLDALLTDLLASVCNLFKF